MQENAHQSRFLEAPLVRQADGELKKPADFAYTSLAYKVGKL